MKEKTKKRLVKVVIIFAGIALLLTTFLPFIPYILGN